MLKLVQPSDEYEEAYLDYITEWECSSDKIIPYASMRHDLNYTHLLNKWAFDSTEDARITGFVPATLFFLINDDKRILGALHIRHDLNERLLKSGGHIGYGVRPSERRKGYASHMLSLSLPIARSLGISKALICCDKNNIGSARTIQKNGGILENELEDENEIVQRYWIAL